MAQAATMGPPLSPRETRRSGRRSAPSASTSTSKSPDSDQPPRQKDSASRPALSSSNSNGRNKRLKQEDLEEGVDERRTTSAPSVASNGSTHGASNGKGKRKGKEKPPPEEPVENPTGPSVDQNGLVTAEEEEQGITRCVCGSTEDDPDAGEFMVQCEGCKVWQHGLCMGFLSEDQVHDDDYYCEQCKPELHGDLLRRLSIKKGRQVHPNSHHNSSVSRVSRSHSPSLISKQPSKRRNTMNSRDANFDESLKEIIEATAAEAAAVKDGPPGQPDEEITVAPEVDAGDVEVQSNGKKKRKRVDDEPPAKKRTRSASTASDRQGSVLPRAETPANGSTKAPSQAPAPPKATGRQKRGGRKPPVIEIPIPLEGEEVISTATAPAKRGGGNRKGGGAKRPPLSHAVSHNSGGANQEHVARRNPGGGANSHHSGSGHADSRAYRNTHAYVVSQQPLLTSWGLPDYLAHLEHMLPTHIPQPLEVRAGPSTTTPGSRGDSVERTMERGVRVKWPSKRMSVGDMNKRVRALVEWVGREQANALDRERRRDALEQVMTEQAMATARAEDEGDAAMAFDGASSSTPLRVPTQNPEADVLSIAVPKAFDKESSASTMKLMEELMEELIGFQEKFGPGAKTRERRHANFAAS